MKKFQMNFNRGGVLRNFWADFARITTILFFMFIFYNQSSAQITFNSTYDAGGAEGIFDITSNNNGYCFVMTTIQNPSGFQITFIDSVGIITNAKTYFTPTAISYLYPALPTFDQNYVTGCHYSDFLSQTSKFYLIKFDHQGDTLWTNLYSAQSGYEYFGRYLLQTSDSGFLFSGAFVDTLLTNAEFCLLKTDSLGNFQWMNTFGGNSTDDAFSSIETSDHGFLTIGYTRSFGFGNGANRDDLLVKWDSLGNYQWHKTFGTTSDDIGLSIIRSTDGNYIIGSGKYTNTLTYQGKIIKVDESGNVIWQYLYGTKSDSFWMIQERTNTDIIAVGSSENQNNWQDGFLICTDSSGIEKWQRKYRIGNFNCYFRGVKETTDGGIICVGFGRGASGSQDGWVVKLDSTGCLSAMNCGEPTGLFEVASSTLYNMTVSPNPVSTQAIIKVDGLSQRLLNEPYRLRVYDLTGRLVQSSETGFLVADTWIQCIWKPIDLNTGVYLLEVSTYSGENLGRVKVILDVPR